MPKCLRIKKPMTEIEKDAKAIGDLARSHEGRDSVQAQVIVKLCDQLVVHKDQESGWVARAIGNLCVDHDGNRAKVIECGGVERLIEVGLRESSGVWEIRNVCGAIGNIAGSKEIQDICDVAWCQGKTAGLADKVFGMQVEEKSAECVAMWVQMMYNLGGSERVREDVMEKGIMHKAARFFKDQREMIADEYLVMVSVHYCVCGLE